MRGSETAVAVFAFNRSSRDETTRLNTVSLSSPSSFATRRCDGDGIGTIYDLDRN
jgi:hypothetical protein